MAQSFGDYLPAMIVHYILFETSEERPEVFEKNGHIYVPLPRTIMETRFPGKNNKVMAKALALLVAKGILLETIQGQTKAYSLVLNHELIEQTYHGHKLYAKLTQTQKEKTKELFHFPRLDYSAVYGMNQAIVVDRIMYLLGSEKDFGYDIKFIKKYGKMGIKLTKKELNNMFVGFAAYDTIRNQIINKSNHLQSLPDSSVWSVSFPEIIKCKLYNDSKYLQRLVYKEKTKIIESGEIDSGFGEIDSGSSIYIKSIREKKDTNFSNLFLRNKEKNSKSKKANSRAVALKKQKEPDLNISYLDAKGLTRGVASSSSENLSDFAEVKVFDVELKEQELVLLCKHSRTSGLEALPHRLPGSLADLEPVKGCKIDLYTVANKFLGKSTDFIFPPKAPQPPGFSRLGRRDFRTFQILICDPDFTGVCPGDDPESVYFYNLELKKQYLSALLSLHHPFVQLTLLASLGAFVDDKIARGEGNLISPAYYVQIALQELLGRTGILAGRSSRSGILKDTFVKYGVRYFDVTDTAESHDLPELPEGDKYLVVSPSLVHTSWVDLKRDYNKIKANISKAEGIVLSKMTS